MFKESPISQTLSFLLVFCPTTSLNECRSSDILEDSICREPICGVPGY